jgi:hypothetical protein
MATAPTRVPAKPARLAAACVLMLVVVIFILPL